MKIPEKGQDPESVLASMQDMRKQDADWRAGKTFSLVYFLDDEHTDLLKQAYTMFFSENGLSPMAFPSLRRFETEVISMVVDMLGGGPGAIGSMTSGGTESILMAVKAARQWAKANKPDIAKPEVILPITVHPAFEKAMHYFDLQPVHIPVGEDFRANVEEARKAVNKNTILMVGSSPSYPHGVIDPIEELASIAADNGILFHVDACLGGFLLPWLKKLGYPIPPFDLSVEGVTSMSADIHKYGFASKGASCVLYRDEELRKHQYFAYTQWPGGLYASPSATGTRPGGAIAAAWATLKHMGQDGYLATAKNIMNITERFKKGIEQIDGLRILGNPDMSVFAFTTDKGDIFALGDELENQGWHLDRQPGALHMMITPVHENVVDEFLSDLGSAAKKVASSSDGEVSGMAAMYGMVAALPDKGQAKEMVIEFFNQLMKPGA